MFFITAGLQVDPDVVCAHAKRVREALRMADLSLEKACLHMDIDKGQFSRQLGGEGHLSFLRLMLLPQSFWQWYYLLGAEAVGLPEVVTRAARVKLAMKSRRQLRMSAEPDSAERKRA